MLLYIWNVPESRGAFPSQAWESQRLLGSQLLKLWLEKSGGSLLCGRGLATVPDVPKL